MKPKPCRTFLTIIAPILVSACGGGASASAESLNEVSSTVEEVSSPEVSSQPIRINQLGFYPNAAKIAVVPAVDATRFSLISELGTEVFSGPLGVAQAWPFAEGEVKLADFSDVEKSGVYHIRVTGVADSEAFLVAENVHADLSRASLKGYYFNRSSTELDSLYAGDWQRPAAHPDTQVLIHSSAASATRPEGSLISAPKGWYDAGDFNKYVVNSGISTYTLLAAYEHFPAYFDAMHTNIPETSNELPDLLDEVLWNLEWMSAMQDPEDGGVYHKLTTLDFEPRVMPQEATSTRYLVQKSTGAALNFAAVMAVASRIFKDFDTELPGLAAQYQAAAVSAWDWAKANPGNVYQQPADVSTGTYAEPNLSDEFAWAAAELFITTGQEHYYTEFASYQTDPVTPSWGYVMALGYISLLHHIDDLGAVADKEAIASGLLSLADDYVTTVADSAYGVAMGAHGSDFVWGSNAIAMNQSFVLVQAYRHTGESSYLDAALANMDYILGRNALDISFVTGFGHRSPMDIHHRQSSADGVLAPVPGLLAGGPHSGQQDGCAYESTRAAESYLDDWCSYSTNEVAINWNAALVYVSGAMEALN